MRDRYASLREGLVGAWIPSVSGSGLLLPDLSGNGNNGTLTNMGPEDWVSEQYGRALDFDGSNDYTVISHSPELAFSPASGCTFFAYIKPNTVAGGATFSSTNPRYVLLKNEDVNDANYFLRLLGGTINFGYRNAADSLYVEQKSDAEVVSANEWCSIAAVHTGNQIILYRNGAVATSTLISGVATDAGSGQLTSGGLYISKDGIVNRRYFDGQLDDIRIYNRALSEPEIKLLASRPGIGLRPQRRSMYYAPPTGARRRRILTSMP